MTDQISAQLKRVRGQLDGIIKMYENERACVDIVRQVVAARNSLGRVAREILTSEASRCTHQRRWDDLHTVVAELFRY